MIKRILIIVTILIYTSACQKSIDSNNAIVPGLENVNDLNTTITITRGEPNTSLKIGEHFSIALVNNSNDIIVFPYNYNVRLFLQKENGWIEIENDIKYPSQSEIKLVPFSDGGLDGLVVKPIIPVTSESTVTLRIVVSGNVNTMDSKVVGAYLDLSLMQ